MNPTQNPSKTFKQADITLTLQLFHLLLLIAVDQCEFYISVHKFSGTELDLVSTKYKLGEKKFDILKI